MNRVLRQTKRFFSASAFELTAICPLDGRYAKQTSELKNLFSEYALIKKRVFVEISWLKALSMEGVFKEIPVLNNEEISILDKINENFSIEEAKRVKEIENTTNHDVKAVEYFIKEQLLKLPPTNELNSLSEFIHFGCTSEDINNLSYALLIKEARESVLDPSLEGVIFLLRDMAYSTAEMPMMSRTHGQPATPTTMGKEIANFVVRLARQRKRVCETQILGKFNGAVGNFAAHYVTKNDVNWVDISNRFVTSLGLSNNLFTSQIEPHDFIGELSDGIEGFNQVLLDLSKDMWGYISLGYFLQKNIPGQIGSSTMPHKINPIDFENSEGNLETSNALFSFFKRKLTVSRYQRDLSDSTVLRSLGVAFGHALLAYKSIVKGLKKIRPNEKFLIEELNQNIEVLAEPVQMILRKRKADSPYEKLKELTRGKKLTQGQYYEFISKLELEEAELETLYQLTPPSYTGYSRKLVFENLDEVLKDLSPNKQK